MGVNWNFGWRALGPDWDFSGVPPFWFLRRVPLFCEHPKFWGIPLFGDNPRVKFEDLWQLGSQGFDDLWQLGSQGFGICDSSGHRDFFMEIFQRKFSKGIFVFSWKFFNRMFSKKDFCFFMEIFQQNVFQKDFCFFMEIFQGNVFQKVVCLRFEKNCFHNIFCLKESWSVFR